jgi:hypothetical protein
MNRNQSHRLLTRVERDFLFEDKYRYDNTHNLSLSNVILSSRSLEVV